MIKVRFVPFTLLALIAMGSLNTSALAETDEEIQLILNQVLDYQESLRESLGENSSAHIMTEVIVDSLFSQVYPNDRSQLSPKKKQLLRQLKQSKGSLGLNHQLERILRKAGVKKKHYPFVQQAINKQPENRQVVVTQPKKPVVPVVKDREMALQNPQGIAQQIDKSLNPGNPQNQNCNTSQPTWSSEVVFDSSNSAEPSLPRGVRPPKETLAHFGDNNYAIFDRYEAAGDGNCGLYSLGIPYNDKKQARKWFYDKLKAAFENPSEKEVIKKMLRSEVIKPLNLKQNPTDAQFIDYIETHKPKKSYDEHETYLETGKDGEGSLATAAYFLGVNAQVFHDLDGNGEVVRVFRFDYPKPGRPTRYIYFKKNHFSPMIGREGRYDRDAEQLAIKHAKARLRSN